MMLGIRRGRLGDRHLSERAERPVMMVIGLVSVTTGLLITWWLGAPRALFALVAAMVAGVAWARVALRDHTPAQVTAGALVGFAVAATVMSLVH